MVVKIAYGAGQLPVSLDGLEVHRLEPRAPGTHTPVDELVGAAVDNPLTGPPLTALAASAASAVVVVPDATRPADLPQALPALLQRLRDGGIAAHDVTIVVACGTHPPVSTEVLARVLGRLPEGVGVRQHDARDPSTLRRIAALRDGTPVRLAREVVEADLLITLGCVQHHYFAGFGGGPKMIFPGVAGYEEIQRNHQRVLRLDRSPPEREVRCAPGVIDGNPVAEEIREVAWQCAPAMEICLVAVAGGMVWAGAGAFGEAHAAAIERVRAWFEVEPVRLQRLVVSAGGAPTDQTLIQAHKALDAASHFVVDGGEILLLASMELGAGSPAAQPFLDDPDPQRILGRLAAHYVQYGHTTLRIVEKTRRLRVRLVSQLDQNCARRLGFDPVDDPQTVIDGWRREPRGPVGLMINRAVYPQREAMRR